MKLALDEIYKINLKIDLEVTCDNTGQVKQNMFDISI